MRVVLSHTDSLCSKKLKSDGLHNTLSCDQQTPLPSLNLFCPGDCVGARFGGIFPEIHKNICVVWRTSLLLPPFVRHPAFTAHICVCHIQILLGTHQLISAARLCIRCDLQNFLALFSPQCDFFIRQCALILEVYGVISAHLEPRRVFLCYREKKKSCARLDLLD